MPEILKSLCVILAVIASPALPAAAATPTPGDRPAGACLESSTGLEAALEEELLSRTGGAAAPMPDALPAEPDRLDAGSGPYDPRLISGLIALGLHAREAADDQGASKALGRALYVLRANDGLDNLIQIPVLRLLIETRARLGDWPGVESAHLMLHWIFRRNFAVDDPRLLRSLIRLRQWHIDAYNKETGTSLVAHAEQADRLYRQAESIIRACGGDPRAVSCLLDGRCCADASPDQGCPGGGAGSGLNSVTSGRSKR